MTTVAADLSLPAPIRTYVVRYVRLRRRHALLRALGIAAALTIGWVLACCVADRAWVLPPTVRASLLAVNVFLVLTLLARPLRRWLRRSIDWGAAAAEIERRDARFAERLQTVTSQMLTPPPQRASAQFVTYLAGELNAELEHDHPRRLLPRRPVVRPWLGAAALALLAVGLAVVPGLGLSTLLVRYAAPFARVAPPTTTQLSVEPRGIDLVEGQTVNIEAVALRAGDGGATLHYTKPGQPWAEFPMRPARPEHFDAVLGPVDADIRYYVTAGDARSDTYTARVVKRPTVREYRIDYVYPAYLNRPPSTATNTDGFIEAPTGTKATLTVVSSEPLRLASLAMGDRTVALTRDDGPDTFRGSFTVAKNMTYTLEVVSTSNVPGTGEGSMRISAIADAKPRVRLRWPTSRLYLRPRDGVTLEYEADDDYGVAAVRVRATVTPGQLDLSGAQRNFALRRPTTQSSTALAGAAERAVDGNLDGDWNAGSVTHTDAQPNPWWQVELGETRHVSRVQVWNRSDAVPERLSDAVVFVSEAPIASDDPAASRKQAGVTASDVKGVAGRPSTVDVFCPARFVRVQLRRPEYLSLAEVRVLGLGAAETRGTTTSEAAVPIDGDPRRRQGRVEVDLATLGAQLGDAVTLSLVATDTAGQATATEPLEIRVMPHGADPRCVRRAELLEQTAKGAGAVVTSLEQATAIAASIQPTTSPAPNVGRHVIRAAEQASALQPMLLGAIADGVTGGGADAVAAAIDDCVTTASVADEVYRGLGADGIPAPAEAERLGKLRDAMRVHAKRLRLVADGQRAMLLLADVRNLAALDAAVPNALDGLAALREERAALRSQIAARLKEVGPELSPDVAAQLSARVDAGNSQVTPTDFTSAPALLARRLDAAARAEALRVDGDPVRVRDVQRLARNGAADALAVLSEHHAVRRARAAGGIVAPRGLWADATAGAARARMSGIEPTTSTTEKIARLRRDQVALLQTTSARPADAAPLAARQAELAAIVRRMLAARHRLAWGGREPSDSRIDAVLAVSGALRSVAATEQAADALTRAMRPYQPETTGVLRAIEEDLRPVVGTADAAKVAASVTKVSAALATARDELVSRDPLLDAFAGAHAASVALGSEVPDVAAAVAGQRRAAAALARAADNAARDAARAPVVEALAPVGPTAVTATTTIPTPPPSGSTGPATTVPSVPGYDDALRAYFEAINRSPPAK